MIGDSPLRSDEWKSEGLEEKRSSGRFILPSPMGVWWSWRLVELGKRRERDPRTEERKQIAAVECECGEGGSATEREG